MEQIIAAIIIVSGMMVYGSSAYNAAISVSTYKDPITQCEYLYTAGGELTPREDGMGNHYGCITGGE